MESKTATGLGYVDATVFNEKQSVVLRVVGTFTTTGAKPLYHLEKMDPQGINPSDLLLELKFGNLVQENGPGSITVHYSEELLTGDEYTSVTVLDFNRRKLASAKVIRS